MKEKDNDMKTIEEMQEIIVQLKRRLDGLDLRVEALETAAVETKKKLAEIKYELSQKPDRDEVREIVRDELAKFLAEYSCNSAEISKYISNN
ncbi:MAG: hypothetical protein H7844_13075 [Nitrospirae bacterium YQR-1]